MSGPSFSETGFAKSHCGIINNGIDTLYFVLAHVVAQAQESASILPTLSLRRNASTDVPYNFMIALALFFIGQVKLKR